MKPFELTCFANPDELARAVAGAWMGEMEAARQQRQAHLVALSGGRIAQKLFAFAADQARASALSLAHAHFFWADERCVAPEHADSNFRLAQELLFAPLKISESQIHRIAGACSPETAAARAEEEIRRVAPPGPAGQPALDLVLLGMGEDGHVASLFPGEPEALVASDVVYRAIRHSPKPPPERVTLGYAAIAAARQLWVLVSGTGKEEALRQSLNPSGDTPLGHVLRLRSGTKIFSDVQV